MEDTEEAWEIIQAIHNSEDNVSLLLSPTADPPEPFAHVHDRKLSYGSFLPHFFVDVERLSILLTETDVRKDFGPSGDELNTCEEGNDDGCVSPSPIQPQTDNSHSTAENNDELSRQHNSYSHRHKDYAIEPSDHKERFSPSERSAVFLIECNRQLDNLWSFMETQLNLVADEFERYDSKRLDVGVSSPKISSVMEADVNERRGLLEPADSASIGEDSGIEDDHLSSARGLLVRLREVMNSLKKSMETSLQQLDKLVWTHDQQLHSISGQVLLQEQRAKQTVAQNKLETYLTHIDEELNAMDAEETKKPHQKEKVRKAVLHQAMRFRPGCWTLLALVTLLVTFLVVCVFSRNQIKHWVIFMRLVRSPLLIALYFYMYGLNLMAWARNGINYVSIFNFPVKGIPTPKFAFKIGSILSVCFCSLVVVYFFLSQNYQYITDKAVAFLQWFVLLGLVFNPVNVLIRSGRFAFVLVWIRIIVSPFPSVSFGDFWFADQLNSMMALFVDVQYLICYSAGTSWLGEITDLKQCTTSSNGIRPLVSCVPSFWRFMQCLRCYYDTRQIKHLVNAGKYFTTFPVVVFAVIFSLKVKPLINWSHLDLQEVGWVILCWCLSSIVHALYCFIWDVTQDWGLFCFFQGTILRPKLLYSAKSLYLSAIVFDFFIRFACALKLTLAIVYHLDSDLIYTLLILAELLRRFIWNFFRVEYEQVMINDRLEQY